MQTLIIYDIEGSVISQMSGAVREPVGIPFLWVEIPEGKHIKSIDVTKDAHEPIFEDYPKSEVQTLKEQVDGLTLALAEMMGV